MVFRGKVNQKQQLTTSASCNVAFLADTFSHLNALNLQLYGGRQKTAADTVEKLDAVGNKLDLFRTDSILGKLLHFKTLKALDVRNVT